MLTPLFVKGGVRWCTKMGLTQVAGPVDEFTRGNHAILSFVTNALLADMTPIFEWCSRKQRIVIDYPEDRLVLTAMRVNDTGRYVDYKTLVKFAADYGIEVVRALPGNAENIRVFMDEAMDLEGSEGYIIRFDNGHMLKVKGLWYCQLHNTLDQLRFEKDVIRLILGDKLDDAKPFLPPDLVRCADNFAQDLFKAIASQGERLYWIAQVAHDNFNGSKKRFAQETVNGDKTNAPYAALLFSIWDRLEEGEAGAAALVRATVANATGSQGKVNAARYLFGNIHWSNYIGNKVPTDD
jgi:RNA ligase